MVVLFFPGTVWFFVLPISTVSSPIKDDQGLQRKSNRSPKSLELCGTRGSGEVDSECLSLTEEALHALALA